MKALDRKLLRDLRRLWSQALTIALVVASGVAGFLTSLSAVDSLAAARDRFYAEARFADLFAGVRRAPLSLLGPLRELPGVAEVQPTIEDMSRITMPGSSDPVIGRLVGLEPGAAGLNRVRLRSGRWPHEAAGEAAGDAAAGPAAANGELAAVVSAGFADAWRLAPGARVSALVRGKQRVLRIEGIALSPEYVFAGLGGMPDLRGYGIFWVDRDALAAAADLDGAFNQLAVRLAPGADEREVAARLQALLEPYGTREVLRREHQTSHAMLEAEIKEQRVLGTLLPAIFLAVAAFLLNVVISRLVATQREQIAALKALGYPDRTIARHYLGLVLAIVAAGIALGVAAGDALGGALTRLYAEFFQLPGFAHRLAPALVLAAGGVALATGVAGTLGALLSVTRLAPAEAMRPPAPGRSRRTLVERLGFARLAPALRMILRQIERRPWRTALSVGGIAAAVAIVVLGNFFRDAIGFIVESQFDVSLRADVMVWMAEPADAAAALALARLPGVIAVEPERHVPVRLVNGPRSERASIQGLEADAALRRIVGIAGSGRDALRVARPPADGGLLMTDRLAAKLGLQPGDPVQVEVQDGRRRRFALPLAATVPEMMGLNVYLERGALNRALGDGDLANQFALAVERGAEPALLAATNALPRVAGAFSKASMWRNMQAVSARNIRIMSTLLTAFACVIAVGVVYNNARIALAERQWELASLRVLGFSRGEVSALLLGELALAVAVALPLGMALGALLVRTLAVLLASDQFLFPVVIRAPTYAVAGLVVLIAGTASALIVRRRIDRLDLVGALKTRE